MNAARVQLRLQNFAKVIEKAAARTARTSDVVHSR